jgi:hypothetical protein
LLYFSSGSFRGSLRIGASVCPETLVGESIQVRPRNRLAAETVEDFIEWIEVVKHEVLTGKRLANPEFGIPDRHTGGLP